MAVYAIGDVQGCYSGLRRLLDHIQFEPAQDRLWFCGDRVNRGPESLQTLKFIRSLGERAVCVLGNHDLHLLAIYRSGHSQGRSDTFDEIFRDSECEELMDWLQHRLLVHHDAELNALLVHAGVYPGWDLATTLSLAGELQDVLRSERAADYFDAMYGNQPASWSPDLQGMERWRFVTNVFTRMRYLDDQANLELKAKGNPFEHQNLVAWINLPSNLPADMRVYFGHWSTLGVGEFDQFCSLDGGFVWHGRMVAARVDLPRPEWWFSR